MMHETIKDLNKVFKVKLENSIKDFLGCEMIQEMDVY
jgi:hypothetical protein